MGASHYRLKPSHEFSAHASAPDLVFGIRPNLVERGGDAGVVSTWSQDNRSNDYIQ
jgi:hypothetical protein